MGDRNRQMEMPTIVIAWPIDPGIRLPRTVLVKDLPEERDFYLVTCDCDPYFKPLQGPEERIDGMHCKKCGQPWELHERIHCMRVFPEEMPDDIDAVYYVRERHAMFSL